MTTNITIVENESSTLLVLAGGAPGQGVPVGGTTGQFLAKTSDTSYDTEWSDTFDVIKLNTSAGVTVDTGEIAWNATERTFDGGINGVTLQFGQEVHYPPVKNGTTATIPDGTAIMATGTDGNSGRITVAPAIADGTYPPEVIMGVATEDILAGEIGFVTHFGKVRGLDTSAWSDGDILYADPTTPGGLTNVEPQSPNATVQLAIVINSHATVGTLQVRPTVIRRDVAHLVSVPASATSSGAVGDYAADVSYAYFCVATDTWRRVAISTW